MLGEQCQLVDQEWLARDLEQRLRPLGNPVPEARSTASGENADWW
jgi:hypothetical protein